MNVKLSSTPPPSARGRSWLRIRFSLFTLLGLILLLSCVVGLWYHWEPWVEVARLPGEISRMEVAPDGSCLVAMESVECVSQTESRIRISIWDPDAHSRRFSWITTAYSRLGSGCDISGSCFSPDGKWYFLYDCKTIKGWDTRTGRSFDFGPVDPLFWQGGTIVEPQFSADSKVGLLYVQVQNKTFLLDLENGKVTGTLPFSFVCLSPDGRWIVYREESGALCLWSLSDNREAWNGKAAMPNGDATFTPDSRFIFLSDHDTAVVEIPGGTTVRTLPGQLIAASHRAQRVVTCEMDWNGVISKTVLWDLAQGRALWSHTEQIKPGERGACFSPDGRYVLIHSADIATMIDTRQGMTLYSFPMVYSAVFSPDGSCLVADDGEGVYLWMRDSATGQILHDSLYARHFNVQWYPDRKRLAVIQVIPDGEGAVRGLILERRRPEPWWGVAWLPETWVGLIVLCALVWRRVRSDKVPTPSS